MARYLPNSDVSYPTSIYGGGPPYYSLVNKLVPEGCPGTGSISNNVGAAAATAIEFGLPTLSSTPSNCQLKLYSQAEPGQLVSFVAYAKQSGTVMFQSALFYLPTTEGETIVGMPIIGSPSSDSGWSIELSCSGDSSGSQFWIFGVEVDFSTSGGNGGAAPLLALLEQDLELMD